MKTAHNKSFNFSIHLKHFLCDAEGKIDQPEVQQVLKHILELKSMKTEYPGQHPDCIRQTRDIVAGQHSQGLQVEVDNILARG